MKKQINLAPEITILDTNSRIYNCKIPVVAITGGIATGKSSLSAMLTSFELKVINADQLIKEAYQQSDVISYLRTNIPSVENNLVIDFKLLRSVAFSDSKKLKALEEILYPHLPELFNSKISNERFVFYEVPLLFEKNLQSQVDYTITVTCDESDQISRLLNRDNISLDEAKKILRTQLDLGYKTSNSNYVIYNTTKEELSIQAQKLIEVLVEQ